MVDFKVALVAQKFRINIETNLSNFLKGNITQSKYYETQRRIEKELYDLLDQDEVNYLDHIEKEKVVKNGK